MFTPNIVPRDIHTLWLDSQQEPNVPVSSSWLVESLRDGFDAETSGIVRQQQLNRIRTLGYNYLKPAGIGKTMMLLGEEREMKRQVMGEETTAENLMGEGNQLSQSEQQPEDEQQDPQDPQDPESEHEPEPEIDMNANLDDQVEEAEEYEVSQDYAAQYEEGFMVNEEYEELPQDINTPAFAATATSNTVSSPPENDISHDISQDISDLDMTIDN